MRYGVLFLLILLSLVAGLSLAESGYDDEGVINDPNVNPRANACFEGGAMEGVCDTEEEWTAGWYLIRFQYGLISRANFPSYLEWVLPDPTPEPTVEVVVIIKTPLP